MKRILLNGVQKRIAFAIVVAMFFVACNFAVPNAAFASDELSGDAECAFQMEESTVVADRFVAPPEDDFAASNDVSASDVLMDDYAVGESDGSDSAPSQPNAVLPDSGSDSDAVVLIDSEASLEQPNLTERDTSVVLCGIADENYEGTLVSNALGSIANLQAQAFAVYSEDDNSLRLYRRAAMPSVGDVFESKTVSALYTGFETKGSPWKDIASMVASVLVVDDGIQPTTMGSWFANFISCTSIDLSKLDTSKVKSMPQVFFGCSNLESLDVSGFDTSSVINMSTLFSGCSKLASLDLSSFDVTNVTSMTQMFQNCSALTSLDLSHFKPTRLRGTVRMFQNCTSLTSLDLSGFDASKFISIHWMFEGCSALTAIYVAPGTVWADIANADEIFKGCVQLVGGNGTTYDAAAVGLDYARVDGLDGAPGYFTAKSVENEMQFAVGSDLALLAEHPALMGFAFISGNTKVGSTLVVGAEGAPENVVLKYQWYRDASPIAGATANVYTTVFADAGHEITCQVIAEGYQGVLVSGGIKPTSPAPPQAFAVYSADDKSLSFYKRSYAPSVGDVFAGKAVTNVYVGIEEDVYTGESVPWGEHARIILRASFVDIITPVSTAYWFSVFNACESIDLKNLDTSQVTDMTEMFCACTSLTSLDVSGFNTSKVTNMSFMFSFSDLLASLDVSGWDTSSVVDMTGAFAHMYQLESCDVSRFDTSQVTSVASMFESCQALSSIDVSNWDTSRVEDMSFLFADCSSLKVLDLSNFDVSSVKSFVCMFFQCAVLTTIYTAPSAAWTAVSLADEVFWENTALIGGNGTVFSADNENHAFARVDGLNGDPGYFTPKITVSYYDPVTETFSEPVLFQYGLLAAPSALDGFLGWALAPNASKIAFTAGVRIIYDSSNIQDIVLYPVQRPVLVGAIVVSGDAKVGSALSATVSGAQADALLACQWYRGEVPIDGATSATYTLVHDDMDSVISCRVSASNYRGTLASNATDSIAHIIEVVYCAGGYEEEHDFEAIRFLSWFDVPYIDGLEWEGYILLGFTDEWGYELDSTMTCGYILSERIEDPEATTMYIYIDWLKRKYTVNFNYPNGVRNSLGLVYVSEIVLPTDGLGFDYPDHDFVGWFTQPDGLGIQVNSGMRYCDIEPNDKIAELDLYAHFVLKGLDDSEFTINLGAGKWIDDANEMRPEAFPSFAGKQVGTSVFKTGDSVKLPIDVRYGGLVDTPVDDQGRPYVLRGYAFDQGGILRVVFLDGTIRWMGMSDVIQCATQLNGFDNYAYLDALMNESAFISADDVDASYVLRSNQEKLYAIWTLWSVAPTFDPRGYSNINDPALADEYRSLYLVYLNADGTIDSVRTSANAAGAWNTGDGNPPEGYKVSGQMLHQPILFPNTDSLKRIGYVLVGWSTKIGATQPDADLAYVDTDEDGVPDSFTNQVVFTELTTLYAVWQAREVDLIYDVNIPDTSMMIRKPWFVDCNAFITDFAPVREGYEFKGWAVAPEFDQVDYAKGDSFKMHVPVEVEAVDDGGNPYIKELNPNILYAIWDQKRIEIQYWSFTDLSPDDYVLVRTDLMRPTDIFNYWYDQNKDDIRSNDCVAYNTTGWMDDGGYIYGDSTADEMDISIGAVAERIGWDGVSPLVFYSCLDARNIEVVYHYGGAYGEEDTDSIYLSWWNEPLRFRDLVWQAHRLVGVHDGLGNELDNSMTCGYILDELMNDRWGDRLEVHYVWEKIDYTVHYVFPNGVTASQSLDYAEKIMLPVSGPGFDYPGYEFVGWFTEFDGGGSQVQNGTIYAVVVKGDEQIEDVYFYAFFKPTSIEMDVAA